MRTNFGGERSLQGAAALSKIGRLASMQLPRVLIRDVVKNLVGGLILTGKTAPERQSNLTVKPSRARTTLPSHNMSCSSCDPPNCSLIGPPKSRDHFPGIWLVGTLSRDPVVSDGRYCTSQKSCVCWVYWSIRSCLATVGTINCRKLRQRFFLVIRGFFAITNT